MIDRNVAEADIEAQATAANEIRSIPDFPLRAGKVEGETSPVWLNRISPEDAFACVAKQFDGRGCKMPE